MQKYEKNTIFGDETTGNDADAPQNSPILYRRVPLDDPGRTLWAIIFVKLFILFAVLRLFFFPDLLAGMDSRERADHVLENLIPEK